MIAKTFVTVFSDITQTTEKNSICCRDSLDSQTHCSAGMCDKTQMLCAAGVRNVLEQLRVGPFAGGI